MRARRVAAAQPDALSLSRKGRILWREEEIAQIEPTDDPLKPTVSLLVDEHLSGPDKEKVQARLEGEVVTLREKFHELRRRRRRREKTTRAVAAAGPQLQPMIPPSMQWAEAQPISGGLGPHRTRRTASLGLSSQS